MQAPVNNSISIANNANISKSSHETMQKVQTFFKFSLIHIAIQLSIIIIFTYYFFSFDINQEIKDSLETIFPKSDKSKSTNDVVPILIGCLTFGMYTCLPVVIGTIVWRTIYNLKYIKFFDGHITWFNNIIFYIIYSLGSSILPAMVTDKKDEFYQVIAAAEVYSAFIMGFAIVFIGYILVFSLWASAAAGTTEVGRGWQGNTQIIYYEYNETEDWGCGGSKIAKIIRCTYKMMTIFGLAFPVLIIVYLNNWLLKVFVILELGWNVFMFVNIKLIQKHLQNSANDQSQRLVTNLKHR